MAKCARCPNLTDSIESHHVVPLQYGGKQRGQQILICGNCHTDVHRFIEDDKLRPPPHLKDLVTVGREAKRRFGLGMLEARDRRPSLVVALTSNDEKILEQCSMLFNTKTKSATVLAALKFSAQYARRAR